MSSASVPTPAAASEPTSARVAALGIDVIQMVNGYRISQLVSVAARLGIADHLADGPQDVAALAQATGVKTDALYRALRALAGAGVLAEPAPRRFELTPLSQPLRSGVGIRGAAAFIAEPWHWEAWSALGDSVRTGEPAFERIAGMSVNEFCDRNPDLAAGFDAAAEDFDALTDPAVQMAGGFDRYRNLVAILPAGSQARGLGAILTAYPRLAARVCVDARTGPLVTRTMADAGLAARCEVVVCDPAVEVPRGGDAYLLRGVIHDCDDRTARAILGRCQEAMAPGGRALVAEMPIGPPNQPSLAKILDLDALLFVRGARERTVEEMGDLLNQAGFRAVTVHRPPGPLVVLEASVESSAKACELRDPETRDERQLMTAPPSPVIQLLRMAGAFRAARALGLVCELGIADLLADGPQPCERLAAATGTDPDSLYRLLRALSGLGMFEELPGHRLALTEMGAVLRADHPRTLRASAQLFAEDWHWRMWGHLEGTLRSGRPAYEEMHGRSFHEVCARDEALQMRVSLSKASAYIPSDDAVVKAYDLSGVRRVIDVGGGSGALSARLLARYPGLEVVIYDCPGAAAACRPLLTAPGTRGRVRFAEGDYLDSVPGGADAYLLRGVLHNFTDEAATRILINCRRALRGGARILLIEMPMPDTDGPFVGKFIDIESLLLTPGRERSLDELRQLLDRAGLKARRIVATEAPVTVLECVKRGAVQAGARRRAS